MTSYTQFTKWTSIKCAMLAIAEYLIQQTNTRRNTMKKSTIDGYKFRTELAKLIPNYGIDVDNDGQIIIYTNLKETKNGNYKEMK